MRRTLSALMLCFLSLPAAAGAVAPRPMVGFLPFHAGQRACAYAIPQAIHWQLFCVPGVSRADVGPIMHCITLDRLKIPETLADTAGYSRLTAETGSDYLVTGKIEHQDGSHVVFRVAVFSATDPRFSREHTHACKLTDVPLEAISAAKEIAADVGVPAPRGVHFDRHTIDPRALWFFDQSARLAADGERDASDYYNKAYRLALRARSQCPANPMLSEWALLYSRYDVKRLDALRDLHRRCPGSISILADLADLCWYLDKRPEAEQYSKEWLKLDPGSLSAQIAAKGAASIPAQATYRARFSAAGAYQMIGDIGHLRPLLESVKQQHPRSAAVRYSVGRIFADAGDSASAVLEYEAALRLNPKSYRLRMSLISGYLNVYRNGKALDTLKPALRRWPNRSEPHIYAARLYRAWRQYDKAAEETRTVERLDPDAYIDHDQLARDFMRSGKALESMQEFAAGNAGFRQATAIFLGVLLAIFLLAVLGLVLLIRAVLGRDTKPKR